jgi:hypothetical protein
MVKVRIVTCISLETAGLLDEQLCRPRNDIPVTAHPRSELLRILALPRMVDFRILRVAEPSRIGVGLTAPSLFISMRSQDETALEDIPSGNTQPVEAGVMIRERAKPILKEGQATQGGSLPQRLTRNCAFLTLLTSC